MALRSGRQGTLIGAKGRVALYTAWRAHTSVMIMHRYTCRFPAQESANALPWEARPAPGSNGRQGGKATGSEPRLWLSGRFLGIRLIRGRQRGWRFPLDS